MIPTPPRPSPALPVSDPVQLTLELPPPVPVRVSSRYRLELVREEAPPYGGGELPPALADAASVVRYLWERFFAREPREVVVVLFLDARHRSIGEMIAFTGSLSSAVLQPRDILAAALLRGAAAAPPSSRPARLV